MKRIPTGEVIPKHEAHEHGYVPTRDGIAWRCLGCGKTLHRLRYRDRRLTRLEWVRESAEELASALGALTVGDKDAIDDPKNARGEELRQSIARVRTFLSMLEA